MTKIALTAAALLIATGSAFAGGDYYSPANINHSNASIPNVGTQSNVDNTPTASIREQATPRNSVVKPDIAPDPSQRVWGR